MKALGNFVVETNNGDGWNIETDPDTNAALLTRDRARKVRDAYKRVLADADKPYRVRVVRAK
jgi:hypothetical protein